MKLVVGLGNPGKQYEKTRHNIGFLVLDLLVDDFTLNKKFNAFVQKIDDVVYLKPLTYMNESGHAVAAVMQFYKIKNKDLIVIHDDKDIDFGVLRIRNNCSSAGHNGIKSIIENIGTQDFIRFRMGINRRDEKKDTVDLVMGKFSTSEKKQLPEFLDKTKKAVETALAVGLNKAMNMYNG